MRRHTLLPIQAMLIALVVVCAVTATAQEVRTVTLDRGVQDPAVSPDGNQIAVGIMGDIWVIPIDGGEASQVTRGDGWDAHPAWSPDGRFLAYAHQRPGRSELVVRSLASGGARTVLSTEHSIGQIVFHPTRNRVFFLRDVNQHEAHVWSVRTEGSDLQQITFGANMAEWSFAILPAGDELALEWVEQWGTADVFRTTIDGGSVIERVTESPSDEFGVQFTPDGSFLVYGDRDEGMDHITVRSLADGSTRRVFSSVYDGKQLAMHPDGRSIVMAAARQLWRVDLESGNLAAIPFEAALELPGRSPGNLVIGGAQLFDGITDEAVADTNVEVRDGRVKRVWRGPIEPADTAGAHYIDARGRFLMAGLFDNHFHYWHHWLFQAKDLLEQGITGMRDPGAEISESLNLRDAIRLGVIEGPDLYTLGPLLDGRLALHPTVDVVLERPESAAPVVRSLKALGVDGLKVYLSLEPEVVRAVIAEAKLQGLPVTGDLGPMTRWDVAVNAGINGLNHATTYRFGYLPEEVLPFEGDEPTEVTVERWTSMYFPRVHPDRSEIRLTLRQMAKAGVALDPTLAAGHTQFLAHQPQFGIEKMGKVTSLVEDATRFTKMAFDAGVPILAGTDNVSLLDELEHYEDAGIPRADVLRTATRNGAEWLGRGDDFGTVEVGKKAHLILVDGNPLKQMSDLRKIDVVIKDGRVVVAN